MSHEGCMRRGEKSKDPLNVDRIYFLEHSKPVEPVEEVKPIKIKKEKKNDRVDR